MDVDGDGVPNSYDPGTGVLARLDNCKYIYNPRQEDKDGDTVGDRCDPYPNDPSRPIILT